MSTAFATRPSDSPAARDTVGRAALSFRDVVLTYPDGDSRVTAVDHVDLEIPAGGSLAITGPSGSGKSSLLAVAATLARPDSGSVVLDSRGGPIELTTLTRPEAARIRAEHLGIVFQQSNLVEALSAREQIEVMARLRGRASHAEARVARERADELLDRVGLAAAADRSVGQLSGGQRQRVAVARALANRPRVMLVDEPTSALDSEAGAAVMDLLLEVTREEDVALLLVTHDERAAARCDERIELVDGCIFSRS